MEGLSLLDWLDLFGSSLGFEGFPNNEATTMKMVEPLSSACD